jgi:hypothetical protein
VEVRSALSPVILRPRSAVTQVELVRLKKNQPINEVKPLQKQQRRVLQGRAQNLKKVAERLWLILPTRAIPGVALKGRGKPPPTVPPG